VSLYAETTPKTLRNLVSGALKGDIWLKVDLQTRFPKGTLTILVSLIEQVRRAILESSASVVLGGKVFDFKVTNPTLNYILTKVVNEVHSKPSEMFSEETLKTFRSVHFIAPDFEFLIQNYCQILKFENPETVNLFLRSILRIFPS
jgi:hypothetical protein